MTLRSVCRGRLASAVVLLAFVGGHGLPLFRNAFVDADGPFCRGRWCCCASPGDKARLKPACPCDRGGEPGATLAAGSPGLAELTASLAVTTSSLASPLAPAPRFEPRRGHADAVDPPPKAILS